MPGGHDDRVDAEGGHAQALADLAKARPVAEVVEIADGVALALRHARILGGSLHLVLLVGLVLSRRAGQHGAPPECNAPTAPVSAGRPPPASAARIRPGPSGRPPAAHRVRLVKPAARNAWAAIAERAPDAAVEDDRAVALDAVRGGRQLDQLDVARAVDVARPRARRARARRSPAGPGPRRATRRRARDRPRSRRPHRSRSFR